MASKKVKDKKKPMAEEQPALEARVWQNLCDCLEFFMLHEAPNPGYYTIEDNGVKKEIPEKEGDSCSIEFVVSPGFLARLPFAPKDKAAEWEKSYEEQIAAALAQFGGDAQKFAKEWKPAFRDSGRLKIQILVLDIHNNRNVRISATATASDASGTEIGNYVVSGSGEDARVSFFYLEDDDIEFIANEIGQNVLSMNRAFDDHTSDELALMLVGISIAFMKNGTWSLTKLPAWREGAFLLINPVSPLNVLEEPMRQKVEAIVGTAEKPVFPQQEAVFLFRARQLDKKDCEITITGPWAYREEFFSAYSELLARALEPGQDPVFHEKYVLDSIEDEDESDMRRIKDGQKLALRIFKALGCPEEEE